MPKRTNPYGDSSPLQYKTHVGKKEIDMGVCQEQNMKEVYAKTKDLLFKGAHKEINYEVDMNSNKTEWQSTGESNAVMNEPLPGQMCLDVNCQLTSITSVQTTRSDSNTSAINVPNQFQFSDKADDNAAMNEPLRGQLCLDVNCQLTSASSIQTIWSDSKTSAVVVPNQFQFSDKAATVIKPNTCCHCSKPLIQQPRLRCYFCDKSLCSSCSRNCDNCTQKFCQMCSVLNYDEAMERAFCFNCTS